MSPTLPTKILVMPMRSTAPLRQRIVRLVANCIATSVTVVGMPRTRMGVSVCTVRGISVAFDVCDAAKAPQVRRGMMRVSTRLSLPAMSLVILFGLGLGLVRERADGNLVEDPSFEITKEKDKFGLLFAKWGGWKFEGDCDFRVGQVAHSGKRSCLLVGGLGAKIRVGQNAMLEPGRYRVTAYVRGLDIGTGNYGSTTEFMFDGKYIQLNKNGTFGWTKLSYVGEIKERKQAGPSFGLMATGYFWIDDVSLEKVARDAPLTEKPVLDHEEAPIAPPGAITDAAVGCAECGYRNGREWKTCYACGTSLGTDAAIAAGSGGEDDRHLRGPESLLRGRRRRGPRSRRGQGPADRQTVREHGTVTELARLRFPQGRPRLRRPGADQPRRRDP